MSVEQESRSAIANEVWESAEQSPDTTKPEIAAEAPPETPADEPVAQADPWAGIPAALREEVEGMRSRLQGLDGIDSRLKQTERRLGSVQNELHAAKEAAKVVSDAPSKEQIAQASANQDEWDALKNDFPEWTKATEGRIAAERAEILKIMPDIQKVRSEIQSESDARLQAMTLRMGGSIVGLKHPDWKKTKDTPDFQQWFTENKRQDSDEPEEVIALFDDYAAHVATRKSPKQINAERQERLELSQTTPGRRLPPVKSEDDMSQSEMRAAIAKQLWNT